MHKALTEPTFVTVFPTTHAVRCHDRAAIQHGLVTSHHEAFEFEQRVAARRKLQITRAVRLQDTKSNSFDKTNALQSFLWAQKLHYLGFLPCYVQQNVACQLRTLRHDHITKNLELLDWPSPCLHMVPSLKLRSPHSTCFHQFHKN